MTCRTCKKPKLINPSKNCAVCGGADIRIRVTAHCKCGAKIDVTDEIINRCLICKYKRVIDHLWEDDIIRCGYLGGCGSRLNGKCERTRKCRKWKPYKKQRQP